MRLEWRAKAVWIADAMGWQRLFRMRLGDGWRLFGLQMEWVGGGYLNCGWDWDERCFECGWDGWMEGYPPCS